MATTISGRYWLSGYNYQLASRRGTASERKAAAERLWALREMRRSHINVEQEIKDIRDRFRA